MGLTILNAYKGSRAFASFIKSCFSLHYHEFKIIRRVTELQKAGKNEVSEALHIPSNKLFFLKNISNNAQFDEMRIKAEEEGKSTDGIGYSLEEQKFRVAKEVFATSIMKLILGDKHTPANIHPVKRIENGLESILVASESVGDLTSLLESNFTVKNGKTFITINNREYETYGRLAIKIAQHLLGERDGNPQNIGVVLDEIEPLAVKTIDHEHSFERHLGQLNHPKQRKKIIDEEVESLIRANVFTPFGKKMDLHQEHINARDPVRLKIIHDIAHLLNDGTVIRKLFQQTFNHDHSPLYREKIQGVVTHLELMRDIYTKADLKLQEKYQSVQRLSI